MEGFKTSHLQPSQRLVHRPTPGSNTTLASHGAVRSVCFGCARCAVWRSSGSWKASPADSWRWRSSILPLDPKRPLTFFPLLVRSKQLLSHRVVVDTSLGYIEQVGAWEVPKPRHSMTPWGLECLPKFFIPQTTPGRSQMAVPNGNAPDPFHPSSAKPNSHEHQMNIS